MNVIITGASRGLGKAIAEKFAGAGDRLFLSSRQESALNKTINALSAQFPNSSVSGKAFDLSVSDQARQFGRWVLDAGFIPDILVNNAGSFQPGSVYDEADGVLEELMAINLYGAYHLTRTLLPAMMKEKKGHIFNICSIASLQAYPNGGAYSITKFALAGFSRNLREEMKRYGIKVTAIFPGAAFTDSWAGSGIDPGRIMESADVAAMLFAASRLSPQATVEDIVLRPQLGDL
ncbi:MAG: SDR family oxidoreductase [Bacteroidota bacterium]|nr:SDR family oxidoreductase [Bacteroidota bacterium]MDP4215540.1 SDR family oxidoreductase [Bacteroidota bacterium]MDP4245170.1 SDR family oxidoreductase [Bacteroidota bacterium]MDP4253206.1 SDR family oxidoreductase [Bacteroidota bacterium]MDP4258244.1 SDR family oxidoreductase [Bacteroidota bacterium]